MAGDLLLDAHTLRSLTRDCFQRVGIGPDDADAVSEALLDANLRGISSAGFQRVPMLMRRVRAGLAGGTERLAVVSESGALCRMDGAYALGPAAAVKALDHAVELARKFGVGLVAIRRSGHFFAAGHYARRATASGMVGIVMSNAVKRMAPHGSAELFLGTNPLSIGIPLAEHDPFVLDMATSVAAQGRIRRAQQLEEEIPHGLAIDREGRPTTDPREALAGSLLPMGGPKGSGLALAISLLTVLLADADPDDQMASFYKDLDRPQNIGHVFIAIDAGRLGEHGLRLDQMIERLLALRPAGGFDAVQYPGRSGAALARHRQMAGVPISREEMLDLAQTCHELGLSELEQRASALLTEPGRYERAAAGEGPAKGDGG
jgi:LDH2 family malate/lactate/ureidoglycolate dehydrogenase